MEIKIYCPFCTHEIKDIDDQTDQSGYTMMIEAYCENPFCFSKGNAITITLATE